MFITVQPEPLAVSAADLGRPAWADDNPVQYATDDASGFFYASGRMDQGHPPVVCEAAVTSSPSASMTAWHFGRLWAAMQHEYRDPHGKGGYYPGIEPAWENYAATGGRNLRRPYTEQD